MDYAVVAVLDHDVEDGTIFWERVCPRAFASFYDNGVIVDLHIAVVDEDIMAYVNVYGVS